MFWVVGYTCSYVYGPLELCIAHSLTLLAVMILILLSVHLRSLA